MDKINKRKKVPETLRLIERRQEKTKHGSLRFKFDCNWTAKFGFQDDRTKEEEIRWQQSTWNYCSEKTKKNRWGGSHFEFYGLRACSKTNRNKQELQIVSSTEENDVVELSAIFPIFDLKDYDIVKRAIIDIQVNQVIKEPKAKNANADEELKKAESNFLIHLKTLIQKPFVDPKLLQRRVCAKQSKRKWSRWIFSSFQQNHQTFRFTFCGWQDYDPERAEEDN